MRLSSPNSKVNKIFQIAPRECQVPPVVPPVLPLHGSANERPEEVEAEHRHPAEHEDAGEVEQVADQLAGGNGDGDEELCRLDVDNVL